MSLQSSTMLADLTIHRWTAIKHDKRVSAEVEHKHEAKDAGRYNKRLIDKAHLAAIDSVANQVRKFHYARTLPWTDKGQRLLPSALFMEYRRDIRDLREKFQTAVREFIRVYPGLVNEARTRLGTMYNANDYPAPETLPALFDIELEFMPVPNAADFRVDVADETKNEIRQQIEASVKARQEAAVKDCWARIHEVVSRIAKQCKNEDGIIRDSLMDNAADLVSVLGGLNITNDPEIAAAEAEIRALLTPADALRSQPEVRKRVADGADAILARVGWLADSPALV